MNIKIHCYNIYGNNVEIHGVYKTTAVDVSEE